jgi:hypothetical protein
MRKLGFDRFRMEDILPSHRQADQDDQDENQGNQTDNNVAMPEHRQSLALRENGCNFAKRNHPRRWF